MVLTVDLPGDEGGVAHHSLDAVEHDDAVYLPPGVDGVPLLGEGGQGLGGVLVEKLRAWHRASCSTACSMLACAEACSRVLVIDSASGGPAGQCGGPVVDEGVELLDREDPIDQADGQRLGAAPHAAEEGDLLGPGHPDQRGSSHEAPLSRERPGAEKIMESLAPSLQTIRSQPEASEQPGAHGEARRPWRWSAW